jgi:hypothetical protein
MDPPFSAMAAGADVYCTNGKLEGEAGIGGLFDFPFSILNL